MAGDTGIGSLSLLCPYQAGAVPESTTDQCAGPFSSFWLCSVFHTFDLLLVFNLRLIVCSFIPRLFSTFPSNAEVFHKTLKIIRINLYCSIIELGGEINESNSE